MSRTVDDRVVEMRFDNSNFEKNVATSMSTLDKLKQKLNLSGASKGLDSVNNAAKNVSFKGMENGLDTVHAKFSALQIIGTTALANITNSAVNAGKKIVNALTFEPVTTGFQEYETQLNAVQTILSNTREEGTNVAQVNAALDELNTYADKTIYNFTEMTRNIGTFTAAGVKMWDSVDAIKGIANLAAVSGSTSQQASTAMYQLSQALAAGKVNLMDWNSVVNAGMGGKVFQDALIRTSELLGTGAEEAIATAGTFRESLTKSGWLTTEVLTETLKQLAGAYSEADLIAQGYTKSQAEEIMALAKDAEDAATKVKTFTQLWDVLKEAAQSGWAVTWREIFGDFEEARTFWTDVSNVLTDIIGKFNDFRNNIISSAMGKKFTELSKSFSEVVAPVQKAVKPVQEVAKSLENLDEIANRVMKGEFGNGQERFDALAKSGYNYCKVQNKVNETLECSFRYTKEQIEAQDKLIGKQKETIKVNKENSKSVSEVSDDTKKMLLDMADLGDKLESSGKYTKSQIEAFNELKTAASDLGIPIKDLIENINDLTGRFFLLNGIKNIGRAISETFKAIGEGFKLAFGEFDTEGAINSIFNSLMSFSRVTGALIPTKEESEKLSKVFGGLFAILDVVTTIIGGSFKVALTVAQKVLSAFGVGALDVLAVLGDLIIKFRNWVKDGNVVSKAINGLIDKLPDAVEKIKEWIDAFKETEAFTKFADAVEKIKEALDDLFDGKISPMDFAKDLGTALGNALRNIPSVMSEIASDVVAGFKNGIKEGLSTGIIGDIIDFCTSFLGAFAEALGVHSPSWKTHDIAVDTIQGFINGIKEMIGKAIDVVKDFGAKVISFFKGLDWGEIYAGGMLLAIVLLIKKIADAFDGLVGILSGLEGVFEGVEKVLKGFGKVLNGIAWDFKAKAIMKFAISLGILTACLYVLAGISVGDLAKAVITIGVLSGILIGLAVAMDKLNDASVKWNKGVQIEGLKSGLMQIGIALLLMAGVVKIVGDMDTSSAIRGFTGLVGMSAVMLGFVGTLGIIANYAGDVSSFTKMLTKISISMLLMIAVTKLAGKLSESEMLKGAAFATAFLIFVKCLGKVAESANKDCKSLGKMITSITGAMLGLVIICALVGQLSVSSMVKGAAFAAGFVIFIKYLIKAVGIGSNQKIAKITGLMVGITIAMSTFVMMCVLMEGLSLKALAKGTAFVASFIVIIKLLVKACTISSQEQMVKVAGTLMALSVAIAIMASSAVLLSFIRLENLAKGIAAVGALTAMMTLMVKGLKGAQNAKGAIMMMAITIGVMAASVAALGLMDPKKVATGTIAVSALMGMFSILIRSLRGVKSVKIGPLITMTLVIGMLAILVGMLRNLDPASAIGSVTAISVLMLAMAATLKIIDSLNMNLTDSLKGVLALTSLIVPLMSFVLVLQHMNGIENAMDKIKSISLLMFAMTGILGATTLIAGLAIYTAGGASIVAGIAALTAMVIPMMAFIWALQQMNGIEDASSKINSIVKMMGSMTLLLAALTVIGFGGASAIVGIGSLVVLFGALGGMAVAIGALMDTFPSIQKFLDTGLPVLEQLAGSIGSMIGNFVGGIGEGISNSLVPIGNNIADFMASLAVASDNASGIDGSAFDGVKDLVSVMGDVALMTVGSTFSDIFTLGGTSIEKFEKDGVALFDAIKSISEASNGVKIDEDAFDTVIKVTKSLSELQESLDPIGGVISWFTGKNDLATFGKNIGSFIESMQTALSSIGNINFNEDALDAIISTTKKLSKLQGNLEPIGGVISWFTGRDDLATFGVNVGEFINSMKIALTNLTGVTVNDEALSAIISATKKLSKLQDNLEPIGGVITWFTGRSDLATFGTNVGEFIISMKGALAILDGTSLNEESLSAIISAAKKLAKLEGSLEPMGGVVDWFTGRDDLGTFGEHIAKFAEAMGKLKTGMGENGISEEVVSSISNAGNAIIALQKALPEEGWFDGKMNLTQFSSYIDDLGTAMSNFGAKASSINGEAVTSVISSATRIKNLIASLVGIDVSGVVAFTGVGTGGFGADGAVYKIAQAMEAFNNKVSGLDTAVVTTSVNSAMQLKTLIANLSGLDPAGIENFKPDKIGKSMMSYSNQVSGIDTAALTASISSANRLKTLIIGLSGIDSTGVSNFKIVPLGTAIRGYSDQVTGIDTGSVASSISAANMVRAFIVTLSDFDSNGVSEFKIALSELSTVNINSVVAAFTGASGRLNTAGARMITGLTTGMRSKLSTVTSTVTSILTNINNTINGKMATFQQSGANLIARLANGITSRRYSVTSSISSMLSSATATIRGYYNSFYSAGYYVSSGLAYGISSNVGAARAAAQQLANAAEVAVRAKLKINSPSKVFREIGSGIPEGLVQGMQMFGGQIKNAASTMANTAINSTNKAMSSLYNVVTSDLDAQPTIRPVYDLSELRAGAGTINGLLSNSQSIDLKTNLSAISASMSMRNQNGSNADIVSAIDKLRSDISNMDRSTYNINGVTYDDGSNIASAVSDIIRFARLERRS